VVLLVLPVVVEDLKARLELRYSHEHLCNEIPLHPRFLSVEVLLDYDLSFVSNRLSHGVSCGALAPVVGGWCRWGYQTAGIQSAPTATCRVDAW